MTEDLAATSQHIFLDLHNQIAPGPFNLVVQSCVDITKPRVEQPSIRLEAERKARVRGALQEMKGMEASSDSEDESKGRKTVSARRTLWFSCSLDGKSVLALEWQPLGDNFSPEKIQPGSRLLVSDVLIRDGVLMLQKSNIVRLECGSIRSVKAEPVDCNGSEKLVTSTMRVNEKRANVSPQTPKAPCPYVPNSITGESVSYSHLSELEDSMLGATAPIRISGILTGLIPGSFGLDLRDGQKPAYRAMVKIEDGRSSRAIALGSNFLEKRLNLSPAEFSRLARLPGGSGRAQLGEAMKNFEASMANDTPSGIFKLERSIIPPFGWEISEVQLVTRDIILRYL